MLTLDDFFHLPAVDTYVEQWGAAEPGLTIIAGLDPRPVAVPAGRAGFLPSGRSTIARIALRELFNRHSTLRGVVIATDEHVLRSARRLKDRVEAWPVKGSFTYPSRIADAMRRRAGVIVLDSLMTESAPAALDAAAKGSRVIAQLDTVFRGANVARHLLDLGVIPEQLAALAWVITVQRLPALCTCKKPTSDDDLALLRERYAALVETEPETCCSLPVGCPVCQQTGYYGDVMAFDVFRTESPFRLSQPSQFPMEAYVLRLAELGYVAPEDALQFEARQFHRTYNLLVASEQALTESKTRLEGKLLQLETANRVLEQRTEALFSLQEMGQALIGSTELDDLADKVCRRARDLCGADRAILYVLRGTDEAEVLAGIGWPPDLRYQKLPAGDVFKPWSSTEPESYSHWPPGITPRHPDVAGFRLRAGVYVPLMAQDQPVGVMIVHSTHRNSFPPGELALLQTFANHAAFAIQRARLIQQLRLKITQLEAAQAELAQKERVERELELAREVQQSVLPSTFPAVDGYSFAARYESARMVGGDFYDVIALDDEHFGVVIADVSDKGIPAALYMALTRSLLLAEAHRALSPVEVLTNVNRLLLELGQPNMFVTVFYGIVNRRSRRLVYTRAGHDRPILARNGSLTELGGHGTMLGLLDPAMLGLSEEQLMLSPGDRLILYTDGVTDVLSADGTLFNRQQFIAMLRNHARHAPTDLCAAVFADLAAYQGDADQYDDTTLLVMAVEK